MANSHSLAGLMKWLSRNEWHEPFAEMMALHLGEACATAGIAMEDLPNVIGDDHLDVVWGCIFEDFLTHELEDGTNIVDDYLKRRGWNESVPNKRYMTALRGSVMSLYEVSDIVRDEGFFARDMIRGGEPVSVSERSGTHSLRQWDRIATRIVQIGPRFEMAGGALPFNHDLSERLLDAVRYAGKKARKKLDTETLRPAACIFTSFWLNDALSRALHPKLPELCNSDGDDIVWTTARYRLTSRASAEDIRQALAAIPSLRPENETFWNWVEIKRRKGKKLQADKQALIAELNDGSVVLGTLELKGKTLVLEANSIQRVERGRALIEPALAELVGHAAIEAKTVAEMMTTRNATNSEALSSRLPPDEERAALHDFLNQHYRGVLDEKVPMLGNVTPRAAAKTAKGREKLVAWLKLLENSAAKDMTAQSGYDLTWMWDELGIAKLRM